MTALDLNALKAFVQIVQAGSLSQAARQSQSPKSTLSHKLATLEAELGTVLLRRDRRKLSITPEGAKLFETAQRLLDELEETREAIAGTDAELKGTLRVTAPAEMGSRVFPGLVQKFLKDHPKVEVDLVLTDRVLDLVSDRIDVAIRAGSLEDSSLLKKRIGSSEFRVYASPNSLKKFGEPKTPADLAQVPCLRFTLLPQAHTWELKHAHTGKRAQVEVQGRASASDLIFLKDMAVSGGGFALLPSMICAEDAASGKLVRVLPEWSAEREPIHALYLKQKAGSRKVRLFVEALVAHLGPTLEVTS